LFFLDEFKNYYFKHIFQTIGDLSGKSKSEQHFCAQQTETPTTFLHTGKMIFSIFPPVACFAWFLLMPLLNSSYVFQVT